MHSVSTRNIKEHQPPSTQQQKKKPSWISIRSSCNPLLWCVRSGDIYRRVFFDSDRRCQLFHLGISLSPYSLFFFSSLCCCSVALHGEREGRKSDTCHLIASTRWKKLKEDEVSMTKEEARNWHTKWGERTFSLSLFALHQSQCQSKIKELFFISLFLSARRHQLIFRLKKKSHDQTIPHPQSLRGRERRGGTIYIYKNIRRERKNSWQSYSVFHI